MNCADIEILICDYVDATLPAGQRALVEHHLSECLACAAMARDGAAAVAFMEIAADVEPPPELVTRILFDAPWRTNKLAAKGWRGQLAGWLHPILQPKFAMGAAMTILSFSILSRWTPVRQLQPSDLQPAAIWRGLENRVIGAWDRSVKFYDNLKFVYQIQATLHEWQQQDEEQRPVKSRTTGRKTDDHRLPARSAPAGGADSPSPAGIPPDSGGVNH